MWDSSFIRMIRIRFHHHFDVPGTLRIAPEFRCAHGDLKQHFPFLFGNVESAIAPARCRTKSELRAEFLFFISEVQLLKSGGFGQRRRGNPMRFKIGFISENNAARSLSLLMAAMS